MLLRFTLVLFLASGLAAAAAQDAERGRALFNQTAAVTGKPVANCTGCHADPETLRALLTNRGVPAGDAKAIRTLLQAAIAGALPGARNAKAQYQTVLSEQDLIDLAAYLARVQAASQPPRLALR